MSADLSEMAAWADEELDPELQACIVDTAAGPMIGHPLVHTFLTPLAGMHNRQLAARKKLRDEALAERDWFVLLHLVHENPYRVDAFAKYMDRMTDREYWEQLGGIWTQSENIWQNRDQWKKLLTSDRPERQFIMSEDERKAFAALPDEFNVYRGGHSRRNVRGLSWTLDSERAEWFANRLLLGGQPVLLSGWVAKSDVIAHFLDRGEQEIVVLPENVKRQKRTKL
jgi:hypothetical protein